MVPFHIQYGYNKVMPVGSKFTPTIVDSLGIAEVRESRGKKKTYARVLDADYQSYNVDISKEEWESMKDRNGWAIAAILARKWDWGDLTDWTEELVENYKRVGPAAMPGIRLDEKFTQEFSFDPSTINIASANLFLSPIKGRLRIW